MFHPINLATFQGSVSSLARCVAACTASDLPATSLTSFFRSAWQADLTGFQNSNPDPPVGPSSTWSVSVGVADTWLNQAILRLGIQVNLIEFCLLPFLLDLISKLLLCIWHIAYSQLRPLLAACTASVCVSVCGASSAKTSGSLASTRTAWGAAINVRSPMCTDKSASDIVFHAFVFFRSFTQGYSVIRLWYQNIR